MSDKDTIYRQDVIELVKNSYYNLAESIEDTWAMVQDVEQLPPAQPERPKGKWINGVCDQCGSHAPYWAMASTYYRSSFCPSCGADMRGAERKEE